MQISIKRGHEYTDAQMISSVTFFLSDFQYFPLWFEYLWWSRNTPLLDLAKKLRGKMKCGNFFPAFLLEREASSSNLKRCILFTCLVKYHHCRSLQSMPAGWFRCIEVTSVVTALEPWGFSSFIFSPATPLISPGSPTICQLIRPWRGNPVFHPACSEAAFLSREIDLYQVDWRRRGEINVYQIPRPKRLPFPLFYRLDGPL